MVEFIMDVWCTHYDDQVKEHTRIGLTPNQLQVLLSETNEVMYELRSEYFDATGHYGSDNEVLEYITEKVETNARDERAGT